MTPREPGSNLDTIAIAEVIHKVEILDIRELADLLSEICDPGHRVLVIRGQIRPGSEAES